LTVAASVSLAFVGSRPTLKKNVSPAAQPVVVTPVSVTELRVFAEALFAFVIVCAVLYVGFSTSSPSAAHTVCSVVTKLFVDVDEEKAVALKSIAPLQSEGSTKWPAAVSAFAPSAASSVAKRCGDVPWQVAARAFDVGRSSVGPGVALLQPASGIVNLTGTVMTLFDASASSVRPCRPELVNFATDDPPAQMSTWSPASESMPVFESPWKLYAGAEQLAALLGRIGPLSSFSIAHVREFKSPCVRLSPLALFAHVSSDDG